MSNTRKATRPTLVTDDTILTEEVLEGEVIDTTDEPQKLSWIKRTTNFVAERKTWLIAGAAATAGFLVHSILTDQTDESCCNLLEASEADYELADTESTPEDTE